MSLDEFYARNADFFAEREREQRYADLMVFGTAVLALAVLASLAWATGEFDALREGWGGLGCTAEGTGG